MISPRNYLFYRLILFFFTVIICLAVFFMGYKLQIAPSEDSPMDRWVGIATVLTAIMSIVIGLVTIWVMFDQQKLQDKLMQYQRCEHQPNFIVKIIQHLGYDENRNDSSYEEVLLRNVGNQSFMINEIRVNTIISWEFNDNQNTLFSKRIQFYDYFFNAKNYDSTDSIFKVTSNREKRNLAKYHSLLDLSNKLYICGHDMSFSKDIMVMIKYIDLYGDTNVKYFKNECPIDEDSYNKYSNHCWPEASINDFNIWEYGKNFPEIQHHLNNISKDLQTN